MDEGVEIPVRPGEGLLNGVVDGGLASQAFIDRFQVALVAIGEHADKGDILMDVLHLDSNLVAGVGVRTDHDVATFELGDAVALIVDGFDFDVADLADLDGQLGWRSLHGVLLVVVGPIGIQDRRGVYSDLLTRLGKPEGQAPAIGDAGRTPFQRRNL